MSSNWKLAWLALDPTTLEPVIYVRRGAAAAPLEEAIDAELNLHWPWVRDARQVRVVYELDEPDATDIRGCGT
jgi:hypothetical protein